MGPVYRNQHLDGPFDSDHVAKIARFIYLIGVIGSKVYVYLRANVNTTVFTRRPYAEGGIRKSYMMWYETKHQQR